MNYVEPIRDKTIIEGMANYLKKENERNYVMFMTGMYSALRISDILKLKISDVANKDSINLREKKTGKQRIIKINPILKKIFKSYCQNKNYNEFLIYNPNNKLKPISRVMAWKILKRAGKLFGVENIGTHTMRKTFAFHYYMKTKNIGLLQKIFNHNSPLVTLTYIGIEQNMINEALENFRIF